MLTILYSGVCLYISNTANQLSKLSGGITPKIGRQSVIESPESVNLVKPPITIINKTIAVILIFITIATGGFLAGTNSGQSFNTFPLMNGKIIPDDYIIDDLGIYNIFENTVAINFNHRWLSIFVFFYILFVCFRFIKFDNKNVSSILVYLVLFFLTLQVILGIITLLSNVYLPVASLHQTNSILLLSTLLISYHQIKIRKVKNV